MREKKKKAHSVTRELRAQTMLDAAVEEGRIEKREVAPAVKVRLQPQKTFGCGFASLSSHIVSVVEGEPIDLSVLKGVKWDRLVITKVR